MGKGIIISMIAIHWSHIVLNDSPSPIVMRGCRICRNEPSPDIDAFLNSESSLPLLHHRLPFLHLDLLQRTQRCMYHCCYRHRRRKAIQWSGMRSFLRLLGMPSRIPPCRRIPILRIVIVSEEHMALCWMCCRHRACFPPLGNSLWLAFLTVVLSPHFRCSSEPLLRNRSRCAGSYYLLYGS
jgi:hypothetical protein